ncbi:hypothetical protein ABLV17_16780 [Klebsiella sp. CN_Kp091]|uniref:hypothetical protein n=1 Tax=Klebsiella sp. CN_Kp091 TaxID=3153417 RepID=UPI0032B60BD5
MSTVVDAGGGVPAAGRSMGKCLLQSTPVTTPGQLVAARGNVYCGRRRWRRPGSWPQQGKMSTVVDAVMTPRQLAAVGEMSTVVDVVMTPRQMAAAG